MKAMLPGVLLSIAAGVAAAGPPHGEGIWKAVVPLKPMHGEFGNLDPIGVAGGAHRADAPGHAHHLDGLAATSGQPP